MTKNITLFTASRNELLHF